MPDPAQLSELVQLFATVITAAGIILAFWQLSLSRKQAMTAFEDELTQQYRSILSRLPVEALLGKRLSDDEVRASLSAFYQYFDLSNEQTFLHRRGRVCDETWTDWKEGMQQHHALPAFRHAWLYIRSHNTGAFDDLAEQLNIAEPDHEEQVA